MKIRNRTDFPFAPLLGRVNFPSHSVTCTVKATFRMQPDGTVTPLTDQPQFEGDVPSKAERPECIYAADLTPFKPRADLLLRATCFTPGGRGMTTCPVSFGVGDWSKQLAVIGNRTWDKGIVFNKMGAPEEFNNVDLTWANAFGGANFKLNPAGKGRKDGHLPNVEYPDELVKSPGNQPTPAGFGPIDRTWKQRTGRLGTYGKKWLKERWPAHPEDFDWGYFNAAPEDQQVEFLRGDEEITLTNMQPDHAVLKTRLPGLRIRCLVRRKDGEALAEHNVPMNLDTLHVDAQQGTVAIIWRGVSNIREEEGEDIADILVWSEALSDAPATIDDVRPWLEEEPEDADALPPEDALVADVGMLEGEALGEAVTAMGNQTAGQLKGMAPAAFAASVGISPGLFEGFGQMRTSLNGVVSRLQALGRPVPPELARVMHELDNNPDVLAAESDMLIAQALSLLPAAVALTGAKLAAKIRSGETPDRDFAGADLAGQDLSGSDLAQADFTGANLAGANLDACKLDGAQFDEANLTDVKLTNIQADNVSFVSTGLEGADFTGSAIKNALFDNAKLTRARLAGVALPAASFASADLTDVDATESKLREADFSKANLSNVRFEKADLAGASVIGARCTGAVFKGVKGTGLRASEANLAGVNFEESELDGGIFDHANLEGANFRYTTLKGAMFTGANLAQATLFGAIVRQGSLRKANLSGVKADNADFFEADFEKADLTGASLVTSNCYGAAFRDAKTDDAKLTETNLKQTLLA
ncbi:MAG: DUF2169 domain-containing protein [Planctomycetes bacterium]|nr:DUF2169 domain-containing protein [Planctomycetota bacterium]